MSVTYAPHNPLPNGGFKHLHRCARAPKRHVVHDEANCADELALVAHYLAT